MKLVDLISSYISEYVTLIADNSLYGLEFLTKDILENEFFEDVKVRYFKVANNDLRVMLSDVMDKELKEIWACE